MKMRTTQRGASRSHALSATDAQVRAGIMTSVLLGAAHAVLVCILIAAVYLALPWLRMTFDKPIAKVVIKGDLTALNEKVISESVVIYENDTFLSIDLALLVDRLEAVPWVAHARARRQWPDTVEIMLVEQKPIAYWGSTAMVNAKGRVFEHQGLGLDRSLPRLWSDLGSPAEVMSYYQIFEQQLDGVKLKLHSISQSVQGDWRLQLDNGMLVILDRMDPVGNVHNFVEVYTQLLANSERHARVVDMRYRHGAAIRWEEQVKPEGSPAENGTEKVSGALDPVRTDDMNPVHSGSGEVRQEWLQIKVI